MYGNIKKLNKELNKKINIKKKNKEINTFLGCEHIIFNKQDYCSLDLKQAYDDQKAFDFCGFDDFLRYEEWLEDVDGYKKR